MKIKPDQNAEEIFGLMRHSVPITAVIDGAEVGKKIRCVAPDHDDQNPSMHVYDDGHVYCFACTFRGDVVDVWAATHGFDRPVEAALDLAREFDVALPETSPEARQEAQDRRQKEERHLDEARTCHAALARHRAVADWWEGRGFGPDLQQSLLLGANGDGTEATIPFWHRGRVQGLIRRKLEGNPKYVYPTTEEFVGGYRPLFVPAPLVQGETFLVEGPIDSLAVAASGRSSIAVGGTGISAAQCDELRRLVPAEARVHALPDDDERGEEAALYWARRLYPTVEICTADYGEDHKDVADLFSKDGADGTRERIDGLAAGSKTLVEVETDNAAKLGTPRKRLEYATKHVVPLVARILPKSMQEATMGLVAAQLDGVQASWLNKAVAEATADLEDGLQDHERATDAKAGERDDEEEHREKVEEKQGEIDALFGPGVLGRLRQQAAEIHKLRKADDPLELVILVALGAQLATLPNGRPLGASILLTAESGRGKNALCDAAVECLPPEFYNAFEIASGQSLYYACEKDPEYLKHTFVYPNESEGVDALVEFLRPMLSQGSAHKLVTNKDASGRNALQEIIAEGPVTTVIPTVKNKTDGQLQTRLLVAELEDYDGRVRDHTQAVSDLLRPEFAEADHSEALFLWQEGLRQLTAKRRVVFPLNHPDFALSNDEIKHGARLWANLLGIMAAHAWLEQKNRETIKLSSGEEAMVAEPEDYAAAHRLFTRVCKRSVVNLSGTHRKILDALFDLGEEFPNRDGFTQREIAKGAGVALGTVSNNKTFLVTSVKLIAETEYGLHLVRDAEPSWWREDGITAGLPTPEQVCAWWQETNPPDGDGDRTERAEHAEHAERAPNKDSKAHAYAGNDVQQETEHGVNASNASETPGEQDEGVQPLFNEGVNGQNGTGKANNGHAEDVFSAFSAFKGSWGSTGGKVVHIDGPHAYDLYVGRKNRKRRLPESEFANPYKEGRDGDRATVIEKFYRDLEREIEADPDRRARVRGIAGKTLACFCAKPEDAVLLPDDPLRCHGQILLRVASRLAGEAEKDSGDSSAKAHGEPSKSDEDLLAGWLSEPPPSFIEKVDAWIRNDRNEGLLKQLINHVTYEVYKDMHKMDKAVGPVREWAESYVTQQGKGA